MKVKEILAASDRTLISFELLPPLKGGDIGKVYNAIEPLMEFSPSFINLTYHRDEEVIRQRPDGTLERITVTKRPGTVALAAAIMKRYDVEVVPHLVCGGLDRHTIENILIDLNFLDIDNVMALRGDPAPGERFFTPTRGGHAYCSDLVRQISDMNRGVYLDELQQNPIPTHFCIGVAGYPEKHYESPNLSRHPEPEAKSGRGGRLHRHAALLRQRPFLRLRGAVPRRRYYGTDNTGTETRLVAETPRNAPADVPHRYAGSAHRGAVALPYRRTGQGGGH